MAQSETTKTRGIQLIRSDMQGSIIRFFDRREENVQKAFIAQVDVADLGQAALYRAAGHGLTQNLLDSSNKLEGDARIEHIRNQCRIVQAGGWASAPSEVNIESAKAKMIAALISKGKSPEQAAALVEALGV